MLANPALHIVATQRATGIFSREPKSMDYFITRKIGVDHRGEAQLQEIAGPFRTVTQLVEAVDTLLNYYSVKFASKRFVFWIQETNARHNLILEELPADRAKW